MANSRRPLRFRYEPASLALIQELVELVERGESCVLFGFRGIGKQLLISAVKRRLRQGSECQFIQIRLERHRELSQDELRKLILSELSHGFPDWDWSGLGSLNDLEEVIASFLAARASHVVFQVSNVDLLPEAQARQLLKIFRHLTQLAPRQKKGRFSVLLTGAVELASLVHGPDSEFNVSDQFMIQGFARDLFEQEFTRLTNATGLQLEPAALVAIHAAAGGNMLLARLLLDSVMDMRRREESPPSLIDSRTVDSVLVELSSHPSSLFGVMLQPNGLLDGSAETLRLLQHLIAHGSIPLSRIACRDTSASEVPISDLASEVPPTDLELLGVANRSLSTSRLEWASQVMERFITDVFTRWTMGDAFASCDCFEEALNCYAAAWAARKMWTGGVSRRPRLPAAVQAFAAHLIAQPAGSSAPLADLRLCLLVGGVELLGFDSITFWQREPALDASAVPSWVPLSLDSPLPVESIWQRHRRNPEDADPERALMARQRRDVLLRSLGSVGSGVVKLELADETFALVFGLCDHEGSFRECVVLDNFFTDSPLTRARRELAETVLSRVSQAWKYACQVEQARFEAMREHQVLNAIPNVFGLIGQGSDHVRQALREMGEQLRTIGYHRVMFALVDHGRQRIRGVVDCRPENEPDVAEPTDFPLAKNEAGLHVDVQPACVIEARTFIIPDARQHDLTWKQTVEIADMRAIAVLPLKLDDEVLGTMHVEKLDKSVPTHSEIRWLEERFTPQLTRAISVASRVEMAEDALQEEADAVLILDHVDRVRFVNRAAEQRFHQSCGWHPGPKLQSAAGVLPEKALDAVRQARLTGEPVSRYLEENIGHRQLAVIHAAPLRDWRDAVIGTVVQIQDISNMACLLEALQELATCSDVTEAGQVLMQTLKRLGHGWGRLYLLDRVSGRLVGQAQFGLEKDSPGERAFQERSVVLPREGAPASTWLCLQRKRPVICRFETQNLSVSEFTTSTGLRVTPVLDELCPPYLKKATGTQWIDLPLFSPDRSRRLGKISVDCPVGFTPAAFKILSIFVEAVSATINGIKAREQRETARTHEMRRSMLQAIGITCHMLGSRLASLGTLGSRFDRARSQEKIDHLVTVWNQRLQALRQTIEETKLRLRPVQLQLERISLIELLRTLFSEHLTDDEFKLVCQESEFQIDADPRRLREIFEELLQNARKACGVGILLRVRIEVDQSMRYDVRMCRIDFSDNGPGISADRRERVFEPTFTEWPDAKGTGFGLSLVETVIRAHHGTIQVIDPPFGKGACFRIEFPRYRP